MYHIFVLLCVLFFDSSSDRGLGSRFKTKDSRENKKPKSNKKKVGSLLFLIVCPFEG